MPSRPSDSKLHPHNLPLWDEAERARRQKAALPDFSGPDKLAQHEVEFVERMNARGEKLTWIPKGVRDPKTGKTPPTSDFYWDSHSGSPTTELKSTSRDPRRIAGRISDAVINARPAIKENFIVDLGPHELDSSLEHKLANYNRNRVVQALPGAEPPLITSLWVLSEDGTQLRQIRLET